MNYSAYDPQSTRRLHLLARVLYAIALIIFGRLIFLQIFKHAELKDLAIRQQEKEIDLREMRGTIFDADQKPLAISVPVDSVCVNPRRVKDPGFAAAVLAGALKLNEAELRDHITAAKEANHGFLWIKRKLSPEESETAFTCCATSAATRTATPARASTGSSSAPRASASIRTVRSQVP